MRKAGAKTTTTATQDVSKICGNISETNFCKAPTEAKTQSCRQLCDQNSGYGALRCYNLSGGCPGANGNNCYPYHVWTGTPNGSNYYSPNLQNGTLYPTNNNLPTNAFTVRCVLDLNLTPCNKYKTGKKLTHTTAFCAKIKAMRINKYIAQTGIASRRKADELIQAGRVKVNGEVVTMLGFEIRRKDKVYVDDKLVRGKNFEYFRFYKPAGYITTASDEKGRKTIYDLLPDTMQSMKPVGRLDKDSSGLIILTNDGDLIYDLTHPSIKVSKVYRVTVDAKLTKADLETLAKGIEIEKGKVAYADVELLEATNKESLLEMTLYQGMNRQIRRMIEFLGHNVVSLKRIRHATIELTGLKKGQFKPLKPKQIKELRTYIEKIVNKEEDNA